MLGAMMYKNLRVRAVLRFGNGMVDTRRIGGSIPLYSAVLCSPFNDEELKNPGPIALIVWGDRNDKTRRCLRTYIIP
jgi:hypothetical protein